jgi:hypothetical protein
MKTKREPNLQIHRPSVEPFVRKLAIRAAACCLLPCALGLSALAQGTAFTYQGRLGADGAPATGIYDLRFTVYDAASSGAVVGAALNTNGVPVSNGLFTVTLDFGAGLFTGPARWLEIGVKSNGVAGPHTTLVPRQALTPSPYAIYAGGAQTASSVAAGGVNGAAIASGVVGSGAIADGSINTVDLSPAVLAGTFWRLDGNTGVGYFLGSTDNQPVELRANNQTALRLLPRITSPSLVGGHASNTVNAGIPGAFIGGGGLPDSRNLISGSHAAIVGGHGNRAHGPGSFIGGGTSNSVENIGTFIGGGSGNAAGAPYATVGGGFFNLALETNGTIGGGSGNILGGTVAGSTIGGGLGNRVNFAQAATIGGGMQHQISGNVHVATVGGGYQNYIKTNGAGGTIAGGEFNLLTGRSSSIAGGYFNVVHGDYSTVGGGRENEVPGTNATVAGGLRNRATDLASSVAGGETNQATGRHSFVGGGTNNVAGGQNSVIGGGVGNSISTVFSGGTTIGGGSANAIGSQALGSTIGGGTGNRIDTFSQWSVIAGGANNASTFGATRAVISGGQGNLVSNSYGTIPGGFDNAAGESAFAAGSAAKAQHRGSWVWADNAAGFDFSGNYTGADFASTRTNQFLVRASGGVGINTNNPQAALHVRGNIATDALRAPGAGINTGTFAFTHRATAGSIVGHLTTIDHPLCNGDPNAILLATHNWSADNSANRYHPQVVGVYYNGARWTIFHEDNATAIEVGDAFNVLVIKP